MSCARTSLSGIRQPVQRPAESVKTTDSCASRRARAFQTDLNAMAICSPHRALPHKNNIVSMSCVAACSCHVHGVDLDTLQHTDHTHQLQFDDSECLHGCHGAIPALQEVQVSAWCTRVGHLATTSSSMVWQLSLHSTHNKSQQHTCRGFRPLASRVKERVLGLSD